ncbi:class I SAM-dependent RNA methyltransferase [Mycetocola spongiae]|uniref:class I SAM-dependent RNA methyltransferase n=1 Tax=Mycetocola spongiae TaxID=2859226 RepID=UPI001CF3DA9E|nr:TRAM domain-containing protein [Mycetocola spongiae]UCR90361.1 class I SAM-dependent RNA methyltransferase [Mycetocola spongiae]
MSEQSETKLVELDVTNVAHGGVFIARHEGRVVFIADAIPGERVLARVTQQKSSFWRAETVQVITASEHRREHIWSAAGIDRDPENRAGGAEFGHIALAHQRELKRQVLSEALERFGGIADLPVAVEALPGDDEANGLHWRTRVSLQIDDAGRVGPYASRTHNVITVSDLPLATRAVQHAAPLDQQLRGAAGVDVLSTSTGDTRVLPRQAPRRRGSAPAPTGGAPIIERVGDREFSLAEDGFWQVHHGAAQALTGAVQDAVDDALFDPRAANLDLYGGVGLLAAALGDRFGAGTRMTSVESSTVATEHASRNLSEWVGAQAVTGRVDRYLGELLATAEREDRSRLAAGTVVLDPPRSGAGRQVVEQLVELSPAQIVYVACDPVALARDLALLTAAGYELRGVRGLDMFPHTHHVEAVASLVRV